MIVYSKIVFSIKISILFENNFFISYWKIYFSYIVELVFIFQMKALKTLYVKNWRRSIIKCIRYLLPTHPHLASEPLTPHP